MASITPTPLAASPLVDSNGCITPPWLRYLTALNTNIFADATLTGILTIEGFANVNYAGGQEVAPYAGGYGRTFSGFQAIGTSAYNDKREILALISFESNKGDISAYPSTLNDKIALFAGVIADPGSGGVKGINTSVNIMPGATNVAAQGIEIDLSNNASDRSASTAATAINGLAITGGSAFNKTNGIFFSELGGPRWNRGIAFYNNCVAECTIDDFTNSTTFLRSSASHNYGLDLRNASCATAAVALKTFGGEIQWTDAGTGSGATGTIIRDYADINLNRYVGINAAGVLIGGNSVAPTLDNHASLGNSILRWSNVYAVNGTIVTSDISLKKNVQELPDVLDLIRSINPIKFQWHSGGIATRKVKKTITAQATETVTEITEEYDNEDGKATLREVETTREEPVFDEVAVVDVDGNPISSVIAATADRREHVVKKVTRVPRMIEKEIEVDEPTDTAGQRTHWGFSAEQVKQAFDAHNLGDFGGYILTPDGVHSLRPDQMIPILWKAMQQVLKLLEKK